MNRRLSLVIGFKETRDNVMEAAIVQEAKTSQGHENDRGRHTLAWR